MNIPGHIAIALVQHRLPPYGRFFRGNGKEFVLPLLTASLFPDIVDKTIGYILHLMPNGRHYAHNIFSLMASSLLMTLIWGKVAGYGWFTGYLGHLLSDSNKMVPWFFPLRHYIFEPGKGIRFKPKQLIREITFLGLVLMIHHLSQSNKMD